MKRERERERKREQQLDGEILMLIWIPRLRLLNETMSFSLSDIIKFFI